MNLLDEIISSSSRVPGVTPGGLARGRAALDGAIAHARPESPGRRKAAAHGFGGSRGKAIVGVAGVAAAAAAAAMMIALPSSPSHPARAPRAVKASASIVTYSITAAKADLTVAYVLAQAARGARAAQYLPDGNVPLVNGWPAAARYWHTLDQSMSSGCPGLVTTSQSWLAKSGAVVADNENNRPARGTCGSGETLGAYPVYNNPAGPMIGGKIYTWRQFAALPTDPAKLLPILQADSTVGIAPYKGEPEQVFLWQTVSGVLAGDPVSPAMRMALYELWDHLSGVRVVGKYTDSLGRTGIALRLGSETEVIDTSNGQILADISAPEPLSRGCVRPSWTGNAQAKCVESGRSTTLYISAGPVNTEPHVTLVPGDALQPGPGSPSPTS
jgi:hypothetical protein